MAGETRLAVLLGMAMSPFPRGAEVTCASPLHGLISFSLVVFVFSFDLVRNYWKWSNHWAALQRTFAVKSPEGMYGLEKVGYQVKGQLGGVNSHPTDMGGMFLLVVSQ